MFFAKQVINNACATQAIVSVLMNATGLELGDTMENYRSVAAACDPHMRGEILGASEDIRQAHNSFARCDWLISSLVALQEPRFALRRSPSGRACDVWLLGLPASPLTRQGRSICS